MPTSALFVVRDGQKVRVRLGGAIEPAYIEVAGRVRTAIGRGHLLPGDQLPSENALAAAFETSRDTVRRGLLVLGDDGERLITGAQGRGWFVAEQG